MRGGAVAVRARVWHGSGRARGKGAMMTQPGALPNDLRALTALRFIAAAWILVYHFGRHLGFDLHAQSGFVAAGALGVDLFFVLSGFILSHVYLREAEAGTYSHARFVWARLARVYPMHLATLIGMIALVVAAGVLGQDFENRDAFRWGDIPAHLLMVHAWGTTQGVGWNFPSWSISAEWAAYLLFPVFAAAALRLKHRPFVALGLAGVLVAAASQAFLAIDPRGMTYMTSNFGALRILPSFALGVALYLVVRSRPAPAWAAWPMAAAGVAAVVAVTSLRLDPVFAWPGLALTIWGLAETSRHGQESVLGSQTAVWLGEISYGVYMTHLFVDIVWFRFMGFAGVTAASAEPVRWAAWLGVMAATLAVSAFAFHLIEKPARQRLRRFGETRLFKPQTAPGAQRAVAAE
jgi:peptidoglycan/LPS O-acetylase OafA/YrhL